MKILESNKFRILLSIFIVILFFGICLDFSFSKVLLSHVDEATAFSSDFKRVLIYFLLLIGSFFFLKKKFRFFVLPLYIILIIQFINFSNTGVFLSPLTIENLGEFRSIGLALIVKLSFLFLLSILLFAYLVVFIPKISVSRTLKSRILVSLFSVLLIIFTLRTSYPVARFIESFHIVYLNNYAEIERNDGEQFRKTFVNTFKSKGIENPINPNEENLSLIIIFTEGLSDRVISEKVTPNLFKLKQNSLVFNNYYNHTAPTFRGLRGQLISGFVRVANSDVNNMSQRRLAQMFENAGESLPYIFNLMNYDSIFIGPHVSADKLYSYMKTTGFTTVRTADDYSDNRSCHDVLSDRDIFSFLVKTLEDEESKHNHFFISMYNIQTHHGIVVNDKVYGNGDNDFYNKFYNYDYWLGNFLNWFNSNSISDNTVLVITADHSSYAVPLFESSFNFKSHTNSKFVDNVPFIVYKKGVTPHIYNAHGRNSLCLAPTLLDLMGLDNVKTHFLGSSLFEDNDSEFEHISIIGADSIRTSESEYHDIELDKAVRQTLDNYFGFSG